MRFVLVFIGLLLGAGLMAEPGTPPPGQKPPLPPAAEAKKGEAAVITPAKEAAPDKDTLFVAALRPTAEAPESTAYGTATLLLAPDHARARVAVMQGNLGSPLVSSQLRLGGKERNGAVLLSFPTGRDVTFEWRMEPTGEFTRAALQDALEHGRIYVALNTRNHPAGELQGRFVREAGTDTFQPPPPPPKLKGGSPTAADVARFLTQATFGPTKAEIEAFLPPPEPAAGKPPTKPKTFQGWIDEQIAVPASSHLAAMRVDFRTYPPKTPKPKISNANRQNAWWEIALTGPDQLRQRVAFALSEIFVISDVPDAVAGHPEAVAAYYDLLARDAFGNFRQLLEDVTRSPLMGTYLSHLKNQKADPKRGTSPDENYAREVMQLFTIGLNELQPDGTLKLGRDGLPIPTYNQDTVVETAKVFTGWGFYSAAEKSRIYSAAENFSEPMMLYPEQHDDGPKFLVGGVKLPAGLGGEKDLARTLDVLFHHPNTGPFICRRLIQRLVTSNPSPGYVYRVASVFARNAHGVRGDLGAVIRALLLDYEARSPDVLGNMGYGKMREPLLQATGLLRALAARSASGRINLPNPEAWFGQAALHAPSVFNFFEPDFVLPGPLAAAGLREPEYQIFTDTTAITIPNRLREFIHTPVKPTEDTLVLNLDPLVAVAKDPDALLDYLGLIFCGGHMSTERRSVIAATLTGLPKETSDLERVRAALDLVVTSADAVIQR